MRWLTTWEILKIRVTEFSVKYCTATTSKQAGQIKQLEAKLNLLDKDIKSDTLNDALNLERKKVKTQLDQLYMEKAIGAQIRSKVKWVVEGEKQLHTFLQ